MKKLLFLLFLVLIFTSCAKTTPTTPPIVEDTAPIAAEAADMLEEGKLLAALEKALTVYEHSDAQRVISDVSGAYSFGDRLFSKAVVLSGGAEQLVISPNGSYIAVTDGEGSHLIDYKKAEKIASFDKGELLLTDEALYIKNDVIHAYGMQGEELPEPENDPFDRDSTKCEYEGIVYTIADGVVANGEWSVEYELADGYVNIFQLTYSTYDAVGQVVEYDSIVVANHNRITAFDRLTGEMVFDSKVNSPILSCSAGDGAVVIACENMFSWSAELFSNKANDPQLPQGDLLRLSNAYTFDEIQKFIAFANGNIVTYAQGSNELKLLYKVNYNKHQKLGIEEIYPTAIGSNSSILAFGTYEYIDKIRHNKVLFYDLESGDISYTEVDFEITKIIWNSGWQIFGDGRYALVNNGVVIGSGESGGNAVANPLKPLTYDGKEITFDESGIISDGLSEVNIGFALSTLSSISYADEDTLFITEYERSGECILFSLKDMKIKARVKGGMYFIKDANKILFRQGKGFGVYEYRTPHELYTFGKDFYENN